MDELQLIDAGTMTDSFMYKLSDAPGFEFFRYVVLVGSQQDCYVPMHTAQATIPRPAETASGGDGSAYMQMATNLMKPLSSKQADVFSLSHIFNKGQRVLLFVTWIWCGDSMRARRAVFFRSLSLSLSRGLGSSLSLFWGVLDMWSHDQWA